MRGNVYWSKVFLEMKYCVLDLPDSRFMKQCYSSVSLSSLSSFQNTNPLIIAVVSKNFGYRGDR